MTPSARIFRAPFGEATRRYAETSRLRAGGIEPTPTAPSAKKPLSVSGSARSASPPISWGAEEKRSRLSKSSVLRREEHHGRGGVEGFVGRAIGNGELDEDGAVGARQFDHAVRPASFQSVASASSCGRSRHCDPMARMRSSPKRCSSHSDDRPLT